MTVMKNTYDQKISPILMTYLSIIKAEAVPGTYLRFSWASNPLQQKDSLSLHRPGGTIKNIDLRRRRADIKILNRFSGFDRHFKYYGILKCKMRITVSVIKVLNTIHLCIICL